MKIHNVRLGFATNSSSTHSVMFIPPGVKLAAGEAADELDFGWQDFTLRTADEKQQYLAVTVYEQLRHDVGDALAGFAASAFLPGDFKGGAGMKTPLNTPQKPRQDGFCIVVTMLIRHVIFGI